MSIEKQLEEAVATNLILAKIIEAMYQENVGLAERVRQLESKPTPLPVTPITPSAPWPIFPHGINPMWSGTKTDAVSDIRIGSTPAVHKGMTYE